MTREKWNLTVEGGGFFKHLYGPHWAQFYKEAMLPFKEIARNSDYVELLDVGRDLKVRLEDTMLYQFDKNGDNWVAMSEGSWETKET